MLITNTYDSLQPYGRFFSSFVLIQWSKAFAVNYDNKRHVSHAQFFTTLEDSLLDSWASRVWTYCFFLWLSELKFQNSNQIQLKVRVSDIQ